MIKNEASKSDELTDFICKTSKLEKKRNNETFSITFLFLKKTTKKNRSRTNSPISFVQYFEFRNPEPKRKIKKTVSKNKLEMKSENKKK